jgi:hypothetical protein
MVTGAEFTDAESIDATFVGTAFVDTASAAPVVRPFADGAGAEGGAAASPERSADPAPEAR